MSCISLKIFPFPGIETPTHMIKRITAFKYQLPYFIKALREWVRGAHTRTHYMIAVSNNTLPQVSIGKLLSVAIAVCRESFAAAALFPSFGSNNLWKWGGHLKQERYMTYQWHLMTGQWFEQKQLNDWLEYLLETITLSK